MAQSRLEKIGTIFTRVSGLLRSGAMKPEDKPLWYGVFVAFPPKLEPRFDRPAPNASIRNIFYDEDEIRAKYHKSLKSQPTVQLTDDRRQSQSQHFITIYKKLYDQGALDREQVFSTAHEILLEERNKSVTEPTDVILDAETEPTSYLVQRFTDVELKKETPYSKPKAGQSIDIQNLFKE